MKFYSAIILGCFMIGCSEETGIINGGGTTDPESEIVETVTPTGSEKYLNEESDYIFDQTRLHTFELSIPLDHLAIIDRDPAAEQYVEASLTFEGEKISPIGVRYKGSIGGFVGCVSGSDWANPSGFKTCTKLSVKVKINWQDKDDEFYGLKKLQFHSQNLDPSQMHERLGYWLFREMGVPAPRSVHARLIINGEYSGIYALTEQIDGRFTRYNFEDGKGNLYKEIWPVDENGKAFGESRYLGALKTNEDENPTAVMIRTFGDEIQAANESTIRGVIEKWLDLDQMIAYAVVDRTIRNDDGAFHWYCGNGPCSNHNYYWYEEPTKSSLHLIPWDLDNTFENIIIHANPVTPIADAWAEVSADCEPFAFGTLGFQQRSAACDKLIGGWASYLSEFESMKEHFINGPFAEERVNSMLDVWNNQIRNATQEAQDLHNDALTISEWNSAVISLKQSLDFARKR